MDEVEGWVTTGSALIKEAEFADFAGSLAYVNAVGAVAEEANHHPDIHIVWNKVTLTLSTHDAGGLTDKDFALARRLNSL